MPPAESEATFHAADASQWRAWLEEHHDSCSAVWLVFDKAGSDRSCVTYDQALDEALCFGWIDGKIRRIDDNCYARRFTPRRTDSPWSESNKKRVGRLTKEGRMLPSGLAAVRQAKKSGVWANVVEKQAISEVPADLQAALDGSSVAATNFAQFPPSTRKAYARYVLDAKRAETRARRVAQVLAWALENKKASM